MTPRARVKEAANMTWHLLLGLSPFNNGLSDKLTFAAQPAK